MQKTRVWSLAWEDPACQGATKLVHHSCWVCALGAGSYSHWSLNLLQPVLGNKRSCCSEKSMHCNYTVALAQATREKPTRQWRPSAAKEIKLFLKIRKEKDKTVEKGADTLTDTSQKRKLRRTRQRDKMLNFIRIQGCVNCKNSEMSLDFQLTVEPDNTQCWQECRRSGLLHTAGRSVN